ncbi:MAG: monofunctional biosynthetic peptidoglycan transglycosylase [bacterium]|nr:monofunctional biosynthetic peptidoglycan transglycosylase [bacterium]
MAKKEKPKRNKLRLFLRFLLLLLAAALLLAGTIYLMLPDVSALQTKNPKTTAMMELRKEQAENSDEPLTIKQQWVSFAAIPKVLKDAVRVSEDASFYQHNGVDYHELGEAIKRNIKEGKKARGGSTITQQLAKNLFLSTEKSYLRKIKEFFIAGRLEKQLTKNRIFHIYLNVIEFGPGVFGVQAASKYYFKKPVNKLNLVQVVRLVSIIPKPLKVNPLSNDRYIKWRAKWILGLLKNSGTISGKYYQRAVKAF